MRCRALWLLGWLTLLPFARGATVVEPGAGVPNLYAFLPEEMLRLRDASKVSLSSTRFVWKGNFPTTLEITPSTGTQTVACEGPFEGWPALLERAIAQAVPSKPPAAAFPKERASILWTPCDFWSLVKYLDVPAASGEGALGGADALALADGLLMLAEDAQVGLDPLWYRVAARAVALAVYAAGQDSSLAGAAKVRLGVALALQSESASALALCEGAPPDPVSQAWCGRVRQSPRSLTALDAKGISPMVARLLLYARWANGLGSAGDLEAAILRNPRDATLRPLLVGSSSIGSGRQHLETMLADFVMIEEPSIVEWAGRLRPPVRLTASLAGKLPGLEDRGFRGLLNGQRDDEAHYAVYFRRIVDAEEQMLGKIPEDLKAAPWSLQGSEIKAMVRARRDHAFEELVRFHAARWAVPHSAPMATAWAKVCPESWLAYIFKGHTAAYYTQGELDMTLFPGPMVTRSLAMSLLSDTMPSVPKTRAALELWAKDQPGELTLEFHRAGTAAILRPDGPRCADLLRVMQRHPLAPRGYFGCLFNRQGGFEERDRVMDFMADMARLRPESPDVLASLANALWYNKEDAAGALVLWEQYRQIAPGRADGYEQPAVLLREQGNTGEALALLQAYRLKATESLSRAAVQGEEAAALLELGRTNEAVQVAMDAARVYSSLALENAALVLWRAGRHEDSLALAKAHQERYQDFPARCVEMAVGPNGEPWRRLLLGGDLKRLYTTTLFPLAYGLDAQGLLTELPVDLLEQNTKRTSELAPYASALRRSRSQWDEASAVLAPVEQRFAKRAPNLASWGQWLAHWEAERVQKRASQLDCVGQEGFLTSAHLIGPFPNWHEEGKNAVYPPETEFELSKDYTGSGGVRCRWRVWTSGGINPFVFAWHYARMLPQPFVQARSPAWCAYYFRFPVAAESERDATLWVHNSTRDTVVFFNGKRVAEKADAPALETPVHLLQGENVVLVKTLSTWAPPVVGARLLSAASTNAPPVAGTPAARP